MRILALLLALVAPLCALPAHAHEFWIAPTHYQVKPGAPIVAHIRIGQDFKGPAYSYLPYNFNRFDIVQGKVYPVEGRPGDRPALKMPAPERGLAIVVHETTDNTVSYTDFAVFESFVTHKDAPWVLDQHAARGLPEAGFTESYRRYAKSLIAVGRGRGQDRVIGLETEIVALANPYTDDMSGGLPVKIYYRGVPRANAQLEVFDRAPDTSVTTTRIKADGQGRVTVPVDPGHEYLLDAVVLLNPGNDDSAKGPVWRSLWASLTFQMPD